MDLFAPNNHVELVNDAGIEVAQSAEPVDVPCVGAGCAPQFWANGGMCRNMDLGVIDGVEVFVQDGMRDVSAIEREDIGFWRHGANRGKQGLRWGHEDADSAVCVDAVFRPVGVRDLQVLDVRITENLEEVFAFFGGENDVAPYARSRKAAHGVVSSERDDFFKGRSTFSGEPNSGWSGAGRRRYSIATAGDQKQKDKRRLNDGSHGAAVYSQRAIFCSGIGLTR